MKAIVASITPFTTNGRMDLDGLWSHCSNLIDQGADDVLLQGTTGEATSLSLQERLKMIRSIPQATLRPDQFLMGIGLPSVGDSSMLAKAALEVGVNRLLVLPPFFFKKLSDDGLFLYIENLIRDIDNNNAALYLYHIPQISGIDFSIPLIQRLRSKFGLQIEGVKDSTGNWEHTKSLIDAFPDLNIFAGNERLALRSKKLKGAGCISAGANISIGLLRRLIDAEDAEIENDLQDGLNEIRSQLERSMPIAAIKGVLSSVENTLRPPLLEIKDDLLDSVKAEIGLQISRFETVGTLEK